MVRRVVLSEMVRKHLRKLPRHIVENLAAWVDDVEMRGLDEARKVAGYHDERLHGKREGHRSIRLSRSYRAIYVVRSQDTVEFVLIEEITKHAY
jgi:proteic killer suppression protein